MKSERFTHTTPTLRVTGQGVKSEEEAGVECLEDVVENNRITPDETHGS